jgi:hypothetical protein
MAARTKEKRDSANQEDVVSKNGHLEKPPVHTNRMGNQFVRASDILKSKVGQKAITKLSQAQLVESGQATADEQSENEDSTGARI